MKILFYLSLIIVMIGLCLPITLTSKFIMSFGGILFTISFYKIFIKNEFKD
jgi:protein-S-isoprenylcysteine O-methyltransferase Ste14